MNDNQRLAALRATSDERTPPGTMRSVTLELAQLRDAVADSYQTQLEGLTRLDAVEAKCHTVLVEVRKRAPIPRVAWWLIAASAVAIAIRLWTSPVPGETPERDAEDEQQQSSQYERARFRHLFPRSAIRRGASIACDCVHNWNECAGSENAVKPAAGLGSA